MNPKKMLNIDSEIQQRLNQLAQEAKLQVPRIESRNFVSKEINQAVLKSQGIKVTEYKVDTYLGLVVDTLVDGVEFHPLDQSTAYLPLGLDPALYVGIRRQGDMLNLKLQLKLPVFVLDEDQSFKELILTADNTPLSLLAKPYYRKP